VSKFNKNGGSGLTNQGQDFHLDAGYQSFGQTKTTLRNAATKAVLNITRELFPVRCFISQPKHMLITEATFTALPRVWACQQHGSSTDVLMSNVKATYTAGRAKTFNA